MDKNYTHITFILDRSGSMASCWSDAVGGLTTCIEDQKKLDEKCTFSFYSFDNTVEKHADFKDIKLITENVVASVFPRGSTSLFDAIGLAVKETGNTLRKLPESLRPGRVLVVIQTDGEENSSREYSSERIKSLISEQTEKYSWDFMFVGSDQKSVLDASTKLGIEISNTSFYSTKNTSDTFGILSKKMSTMRSLDYSTYKSSVAFSDEEKLKMSSKS